MTTNMINATNWNFFWTTMPISTIIVIIVICNANLTTVYQLQNTNAQVM